MSPIGYSQGNLVKHDAFAARLVEASEFAGYNAARLAAAVAVSRGTMARYWRGERLCPADLLFRIADVLSVDPRWLVTGDSKEGLALQAATESEDRLLQAFRRLSEEQREHLVASAELMIGPRTLHSPRSSYRGG